MSITSFPYLIYCVSKYKPKILITGLVGFLPCLLKYFFPKLIIVNSIQGLPKFNYLRKIIWKFFYKKSDYLITMTNKTKKIIMDDIGISNNKIFKIENPILNKEIRLKSVEKIHQKDQIIFEKEVFCSIGRLTYQKNYITMKMFID